MHPSERRSTGVPLSKSEHRWIKSRASAGDAVTTPNGSNSLQDSLELLTKVAAAVALITPFLAVVVRYVAFALTPGVGPSVRLAATHPIVELTILGTLVALPFLTGDGRRPPLSTAGSGEPRRIRRQDRYLPAGARGHCRDGPALAFPRSRRDGHWCTRRQLHGARDQRGGRIAPVRLPACSRDAAASCRSAMA